MATREATRADVMKMRCRRCGARPRTLSNWNGIFIKGVLIGLNCPKCQTPQENAEAEINEATVDYGRDAFGRLTGSEKS